MGLAIIVPSISFEDANLGKVTLSGNVPIRGLYINLEDSYTGEEVDLKCSYLPANTTQRNVVWSIESGSEYASISGTTLTILSGASHNDVTVKCTSVSNSTVTTEKTINVTYSGEQPVPSVLYNITNRRISGDNKIDTNINLFDTNHTNWTLFVSVANTSGNTGIYLVSVGPNNAYQRGFTFQYANRTQVYVNGNLNTNFNNITKLGLRRIENKIYYTKDGITWNDASIIDGTYTNLLVGNNDLDSYPNFSFDCVLLNLWSRSDIDIQNYFN